MSATGASVLADSGDPLSETKRKATMPQALSKFLDNKPTASLRSLRSQTAEMLATRTPPRTAEAVSDPLNPDRFRYGAHSFVPDKTPACPPVTEPSPALLATITPSKLATDLKESVVEASKHLNEGVYHVFEPAKFVNGTVTEPAVKAVPVPMPKDIVDSSKENYLLTPFERRQLLEIEKQQRILREEQHKQAVQQTRFKQVMRNFYPNGLKDYDSPLNPNSPVYGEMGQKYQEETQTRQMRAQVRTAQLENHWQSSDAFEFQADRDASDPLFTRKARSSGCPQALESSHERLFIRPNLRKPPSPNRAQTLRNIETQGRRYDIISGAEISTVPPTINEVVHKRKAHPSIIISSS
eukprot:TRINITY_DN14244_c0_g1_i3.p1 TRINITY_DN14244_c0_g1~~TRINITY_DN14244_c0_g1_i3.p1  ORF type:complete len:397 (+),score=64.26 TRINITY_DN14244_c0_g1_i3:130-1191(+)